MEKKQISAEVIADSKNEFGQRITSYVVTFPRFILAEINTHRMFSRNSASSRAIPFEKMEELKRRFKIVLVLFDNDEAGISAAKIYTELYDIEAVYCEGCSKDPSDYYKQYGDESTKQLLNKIL